ncbi:histidine phosphatase family protein [Cytobacillus sp. IB215316]|uniref:histidine phosphatase family protein n=1 Tax=Cytobacillus sp. IB215316 TaxID=3097354 RepID=UPI002A16B7B0|nr:histidine phosphatase family protein [Cytobacillus sp. IB215316]MDX8361607.1 histidine phosphatase family protein [Cytobacillus sp. IB215316]
MITIGLIRHGVTEWNDLNKAQGISDIPLNEEGRKQALAVANRLFEEENWDVLITSDLQRAIETGQIIGEKLKLPIAFVDERIREINCGEIEGTTEEERVERWGSKWFEMDLGMETFDDVAKRGSEFIEEIAHKYQHKRVLLISHGALIGLTLKHLLPDKFQKVYLHNTSVTILNNIEGKWACNLYNCTKHLS